VARLGLALIFAYHGLVPKLLLPHRDEVAMLRDAGVAAENTRAVLTLLGIAELLLALCLLIAWRRRWPSLLCLGVIVLATIGVAVSSPRYLGAAFNPVSLNLAVGCLAIIDLMVLRGLPSAARCRRRPPSDTA
jgi:uncharacterized membrane protein YphA (DoxX/SURF4 family)